MGSLVWLAQVNGYLASLMLIFLLCQLVNVDRLLLHGRHKVLSQILEDENLPSSRPTPFGGQLFWRRVGLDGRPLSAIFQALFVLQWARWSFLEEDIKTIYSHPSKSTCPKYSSHQ